MKALALITACSMTLLCQVSYADAGDRIEHRLDKKGDRIEYRLDRRGDRIDRRLDHVARHAAASGHLKAAARLDRKGDRINTRLDLKGNRINHRLDHRGYRINRIL